MEIGGFAFGRRCQVLFGLLDHYVLADRAERALHRDPALFILVLSPKGAAFVIADPVLVAVDSILAAILTVEQSDLGHVSLKGQVQIGPIAPFIAGVDARSASPIAVEFFCEEPVGVDTTPFTAHGDAIDTYSYLVEFGRGFELRLVI